MVAHQIGETGIWIGNKLDAMDEHTVYNIDHRISHILNVTWDVKTTFDVPVPVQDRKYVYGRLDLDDMDDLSRALPNAFAFMDCALHQKRHVLVHCRAGVNRSPAVVLAYLVLRRCMSMHSALEIIMSSRPQARPAEWFVRQIEMMDSKKRRF